MTSKWIVAKFGGSSVKDGSAMLRCSKIVEDNPLIKIVIISATHNTTNQLEFVAKAAERGDEETLNNVILEITNKHVNIGKELFTSPKVMDELDQLLSELKNISLIILDKRAFTNKEMDQLYSLGERMSSLLISDLLKLRLPNKKIIFLDARSVIKTNSEFQKGEPQVDLIRKKAEELLIPKLSDETIFVTQGFIGEDLIGNTTTLGREGSDYSAALFGEAIDASLVQIWTDVPGIASTDPRTVSNVKYMKAISYDEATALATLGAKVLFPTTLLPAKRKNIPVFVGSSINPELGGTLVSKEMDDKFSLKGVSVKTLDDDFLVSFIGSNLNLESTLKEKLISKLNNFKNVFEFYDLTSVSISFKFHDLSRNDVIKVAHDILIHY